MTNPDAMKLLTEKVSELGQAEVGRRLGYSSGSIICQILAGTYGGSSVNVLNKVVELWGGVSVTCPILGDIPLSRCAEYRNRPFAATNPVRISLYRACRTCSNNEKANKP